MDPHFRPSTSGTIPVITITTHANGPEGSDDDLSPTPDVYQESSPPRWPMSGTLYGSVSIDFSGHKPQDSEMTSDTEVFRGATLTPDGSQSSDPMEKNVRSLPENNGLIPGVVDDEATPLLGKVRKKSNSFLQAWINRGDFQVSSEQSSHSYTEEVESPQSFVCLKYLKIAVLTLVILFSVVALSFIEENEETWTNVAVMEDKPVSIDVSERLDYFNPVLTIKANGPFLPQNYYNLTEYHITFTVVRLSPDGSVEEASRPWSVPVAPAEYSQQVGVNQVEHIYAFRQDEMEDSDNYLLYLSTNEDDHLSISVSMSVFSELSLDGIIMGAAVLIGLYVLIIFELVHRTLAAMIGATTAIAFLALTRDRPTLERVMTWLDFETLSLLFGMMVLVSILCETGFFDYVSVLAYKLARGRLWPLLTTLCLFTAFISAFLDNVTTILLMTPVTIRLCEVMNVDPKHVLIALVLFSNIGGAATPVGDPPNVIIISNPKIIQSGVDFASFTAHALPGVLLCIVGSYIFLRIRFRNVSAFRFSDPPELAELRHEIEVWRKATQSVAGYSRDEHMVRSLLGKKVKRLEKALKKKMYDIRPSEEDYKASLKELSSKYKIRNKPLLIKSAVTLIGVIMLFFMQSIPDLNLSLGWIAILGSIMLLILADFDELEGIFGRVEWTTLIFFAALFVVMEALAELRLLVYIGEITQDWIKSVNEDQRLLVAILIILWVSALASSFIDNIPFTTVMVKIVTDLTESEELKLPLIPLVYALAFGACLGGNGTLIGASANVVCAGVAEQHGYRFTFMDFFKVGFPIMLITTSISTVYLILCHVVFQWNS